MRVVWSISFLAIVVVAVPNFAQAALLLEANFGTYADGNLVGQNGWTQLALAGNLPLQVTGGLVTIPGAQAADNQDAWKNTTAGVILPPAVGTISTFYGLDLTVNSAPAIGVGGILSPSYFAAMYNDTNAVGFANERLSAIDNSATIPGTYLLAARITGQAGDPFTFGTALNYGTLYNVVVRADMVAGAGNDVLEVFVDGVSNFTNLIGGGTDPTGMGSFVISQFASATVGNVGATIGRVRVADNYAQAAAPEPSALVLVGVALVGIMSAARFSRHGKS